MTTPVGNEPEVVTLSATTEMVMLKLALAVLPVGVSASVTVTVKLSVPTNVPLGVPEITPVAAFNVRPVGRLPVVTAQVYGEMPPAACRVWLLYAVPMLPPASDAVVTLNGGALTVMLKMAVTVA